MPVETTTGAPAAQAATGTQPQEGASQAPVADAQGPQVGRADNESGTEDVGQLRRERAAADREAQRLRAELKAFQDAHRQAEEAKLSEAERMTKRQAELDRENADLKSQLQQHRVSSAVMAAATRLGFQDPADAMSLLGADDIELVDGQPKGVDKALKALLERKPYLASSTARAAGSVDQGTRGGSRPANDFGTQVRDALRGH